MIDITEKQNCCGCSACAQSCPRNCISMFEDEEGFLYPTVDKFKCISCNLCEKVCPVINQGKSKVPLKVYASKNKDGHVRRASSSGGVFSLLVEACIDDGGCIFGAHFNDDFEVVHGFAETLDDAERFRGSKYVQSTTTECFSRVRKYLKLGRKVLFSGTPCQVAGLHLYLRKKYDNLLTVEVVCHGVPSPKLWREYLSHLDISKDKIKTILFKDKSSGWRGYSFSIVGKDGSSLFLEKADRNKYMMAFFQNLSLRPSCYNCPAKGGKSNADITLADYWGIENLSHDFNDNIGVSMVCCNTDKGLEVIDKVSSSMNMIETDYEKSVPFNLSIVKSTLEPEGREEFWKKYSDDGVNALLSLKNDRPSIIKRIINRIISK